MKMLHSWQRSHTGEDFVGRGEASGPTLGLLLAWFRDETSAWKTVKDKPRTQGDHWLVGQAVTTGEGFRGHGRGLG